MSYISYIYYLLNNISRVFKRSSYNICKDVRSHIANRREVVNCRSAVVHSNCVFTQRFKFFFSATKCVVKSYIHLLSLKKINIMIIETTIIPITIQKSPFIPTNGICFVFIPNIAAITESGKAIKANIVKFFIISFCFVFNKELFVSLIWLVS